MNVFILLILILLIFGGGGLYLGPPFHVYGGGIGLVLLIVILFVLFR